MAGDDYSAIMETLQSTFNINVIMPIPPIVVSYPDCIKETYNTDILLGNFNCNDSCLDFPRCIIRRCNICDG